MVTPRGLSFGELLKQYRLAAGLTHEELAERARLSVRGISDLERGRRSRPWPQTITLLADGLKLTPTQITALIVASGRRREDSSGKPPDPPPSNNSGKDGVWHPLPVALTSFVGREREIDEVTRILESTRLLTMTGSGGCGKSRLAYRVASELDHSHFDGLAVVELASLTDPQLVQHMVAVSLGLRSDTREPILETIIQHLQGRRTLVVIDNCEHLIDACARLVETILKACPQVRILATSRERLRIGGEVTYRVPSLPTPRSGQRYSLAETLEHDAVQLFIDRARADLPTFTVNDANAHVIAKICEWVDGIPLAIELAASRVATLGVGQVLARLDDRFRLLSGGSRTALPRHRTLRALIDWSYDLLTSDEQRLFRRLAVFAGGFTLNAAEAINDDLAPGVLDGLASLVDRSLLQQEELAGEARYTMLQTIGDYAITLLATNGEESAIRGRHASYFLARADEVESHYTGNGPALRKPIDGITSEVANMRAALVWFRDHDPENGLRMACRLAWYWVESEFWEGESWLRTFLSLTTGDDQVRGRALAGLATLIRRQGDFATSQPLFEVSLVLCRQAGDTWGIARSLIQLAEQARSVGDYDRALPLAEESLAIARELRTIPGIIRAQSLIAGIHLVRGNVSVARGLAEEIVRISPRGDYGHYLLFQVAEAEGKYERAETLFQEKLTLARSKVDHPGIASALYFLGRLAKLRGDRARARRLNEDVVTMIPNGRVGPHGFLALYELGRLAWAESDDVEGHRRWAEGLRLAKQQGTRLIIAIGLLFGAHRAAETGSFVRAIRLFGAADTAIPNFRLGFEFSEHAVYERSLEAARAALPSEASAEAWNDGKAMTLEQAIAFAVDDRAIDAN